MDETGEPILVGWTDSHLELQGRREAQHVADRLREEAPGAPVYSSPLRRALSTARVIAGWKRVRSCAGLREIGCGDLDGWSIARVCREHAALWARNESEADPEFRWPGGESYAELRVRALNALDRIAARHPGGSAVVVTHTGVITQVMGAMRGTSPACWSDFRAHNASITEVRWGGGSRELVRFDDRDHLAVAESA